MEIKKIKLEDIRMNQENLYNEEQNIEELADSIKTYGQLENATCYEDMTINDGKKYTLVGGHRRYLAISFLAERGDIEPYINSSIIEKPTLEHDEKMMIIADNQQREKDKDTRIREIKIANDYYNYLISVDKKPKGKKRAWIAKKVGIGERTVQDILTEIKNEMDRANGTTTTTSQREVVHDIEEIKKYIRQAMKRMEKATSIYGQIVPTNNLQTLQLFSDTYEQLDNLYRGLGD